MKIVKPERYQHLLKQAQAADFSGWDFSWLGRPNDPGGPPLGLSQPRPRANG